MYVREWDTTRAPARPGPPHTPAQLQTDERLGRRGGARRRASYSYASTYSFPVCVFCTPPSDQVSPPARGGGEGSSSSAVIRARRPRRALRCSAPMRARAPAAHRQRAQRAVGPSPRSLCARAPPTQPEPPFRVGRVDASRPTRCVCGGGAARRATEVGRERWGGGHGRAMADSPDEVGPPASCRASPFCRI